MIPAEYLDGLDVDRRASSYTFDRERPEDPVTWIAVDDAVMGFVTVSASRDTDANGAGEIQALYVAPEHWRSGIGTLLLNKGESVLVSMGFDEASLWVLEANERGRLFYEALGWSPEKLTNTINLAGVDVVEIRYCKSLG
jgi:ribosomal protein S18 acetylase RimI-like enzyme